MRVLMFGWEFPPFISGGLGTACYGLTKALSELGTDILFVLPRPVDPSHSSHVRILAPQTAAPAPQQAEPGWERVTFLNIRAHLFPYARPATMQAVTDMSRDELDHLMALAGVGGLQARCGAGVTAGTHYAGDLFGEVERYAHLARVLTRGRDFDVIHAHDWMTYPAGIALTDATGKPLVVHIHSTEFDRSGEHVNPRVYDIERAGMHRAARVITVSHLTRDIVVRRYGVDPSKVRVVYNAVELGTSRTPTPPPSRRREKIVLFLGRLTMQKGPEYFIAAAREVLRVMDNVRFVVAGSGDMAARVIEMAAASGLGRKVLFTGFLRGPDVERVFRMADLYVMPSVSEPFGLAALEAMSYDVPVIISRQSGVAEVLQHVLKVDFWDVDRIANMIVAVLRHPPLHATLRQHGRNEIARLRWRDAAARCLDVYQEAMESTA